MTALNSIVAIIKYVKTLDDVVQEDPPLTMIYRTEVKAPIPYDISKLEIELNIKIPPELREFWQLTSELRLFDEVNYGQWGTTIYSPEKVPELHAQRFAWYAEHFVTGDLVIGDFRGDSQFIIIRCDADDADFGSIIIAQPGYNPRKYWPNVAISLSDFLAKRIASPYKYNWLY